jgi:hypothetical protein
VVFGHCFERLHWWYATASNLTPVEERDEPVVEVNVQFE